jgi:ATP-dependent DNA helicase RecG
MNMDFHLPVEKISKVGAITAKKLKRLGIQTAGDLLYWFPFRYEDYRQILSINKLQDGIEATVRGRVEIIANRRGFRSRKIITEALIYDDSGSLRVTWFNQPFITKNIKSGDIIFLSGKIKSDMLGPRLLSPIYEKETKKETSHTARLVPIYPTTQGLTQKQIRYLINQILPLSETVVDWLPSEITKKFALCSIASALRGIHFPENEKELKKSTERLKFDEMFLIQLRAGMARKKQNIEKAPKIKFHESEIKQFVGKLPFVLTKAQKVAAWEILKDLNKEKPMNRLLSGDVGSGKTIIAAISLYNSVLSGFQGVLLAPTEILARQHFETLRALLSNKLTITLLSRSQVEVSNMDIENKISKKQLIEKISRGDIDIIVGTHALLSEKIKFNDVGLIVVDEQHRFGVSQRKAIKDKTKETSAHYLSMTATPIPRSLALTIYGDLDLSIINQMPIGRKPVITRLVESNNRDKAYQFIREQVKKGRQIFVICPLIEASSDDENYLLNLSGIDEKKTVIGEYNKLSKEIFPDLSVGFLHGKLKPTEKESIMENFKNNKINILISTSVVEVGVDVPNAGVMMIEGAERFGLAQLHQFRGRVGRSIYQSYCLVFTESRSEKTLERLKFFEKNIDGFKLAEKDLETRGPGEVYGTLQSGLMNLRLAKLTDQEIIKKAREASEFASLNLEKFPSLKSKLMDWEKTFHLE